MNLKRVTLLTIIGIFYSFALRTIGTLLPDIFKNRLIVQFTGIFSILARLTVVFFFIYFFKAYVQKDQIKLQKASIIAIIGASVGLLGEIKKLLPVFNVYIFPSRHIQAIIPLLNSAFILIFFIVFYNELLQEKQQRLKEATLLAVIGTSILTVSQFFGLSNYFYLSKFVSSNLSSKIGILFIPLFLFSFVTVLYFFLSFYREQKREILL